MFEYQPHNYLFSQLRWVLRSCFTMTQKCVHKGCGKVFIDTDEDCLHHPGLPIFHEGQKGVRAPRFDIMGATDS